MTGIFLSLCACLLTASSAWATEPSPFALPPENDKPQTTSAPSAQPASPFALPTSEGTPPETASDPDSAFNPPAETRKPAAAVPGSSTTPQTVPAPIPGDRHQDMTVAELIAQGTNLAHQGSYDEARIALEKAVAKEPGNVVALNNLGLVMRRLGRVEEATRAYTSAIQSDPGYALSYKNYGILLELNGEVRRAVDAYRRYCSLAPAAPDMQKVSQRADWLAGGL
jgi:hypothetical protein